jgi:uncharacterized protein YprB with RNaseH-like and TPR domain
MSSSLKNRLQRIREAKKEAGGGELKNKPVLSSNTVPSSASNRTVKAQRASSSAPGVPAFDKEWVSAGFQTLKRTVEVKISPSVPGEFPASLGVVIPDINKYAVSAVSNTQAPVKPAAYDLLFFDLETTGLSGGAGTVAFLAAFGRFTQDQAESKKTAPSKLTVTQYLLLDYPGENDFITAVLDEFKPAGTAHEGSAMPPLVVTYNGKSFDSQILKTRCLMNGIIPPEMYHADLLHPSRRLWKKVLSNCSQAEIETSILGLDRSGDIPGALAPDIWFDFLKTGGTKRLMGICDHNLRDIKGLASVFTALTGIADDPIGALDTYRFHVESLALHWRYAAHKGYADHDTAETLLKKAAGQGSHASIRRLAIDAEWRRGDAEAALEYTETALQLDNLSQGYREEMERRKERLLKKMINHEE